MIGPDPNTRIHLAPGSTDMRKGFEGLHHLARHRMELDPLDGHLFLFCNRQRTRIKALYCDGSGIWVCAKRLHRGRFAWPDAADGAARISIGAGELAVLLAGMEMDGTRLRRRRTASRQSARRRGKAHGRVPLVG